jgi:hypothetical protein
MVGAGVKPGKYPDMQMVDVAPTLAVLLGTNIPASSEGKPLTQILKVDANRQAQISVVWTAQQDIVASAYEKAIGAPKQAGATAQERIALAQRDRDIQERGNSLLRLAIVLFVVLAGASILIWKRSRDVAMLFFAALVYVVVYNVIFAILAGNVYSMSTVPTAGATAFVVEIAEFTAIAVLLAWLAAMLLTGAFRRGALHAAQATYGFAFVILFLLAIPALLGFAVNGAVTTWRLPDPLLIFLHFTNLIQAMFVAALGIVLSGIAMLVGRQASRQVL